MTPPRAPSSALLVGLSHFWQHPGEPAEAACTLVRTLHPLGVLEVHLQSKDAQLEVCFSNPAGAALESALHASLQGARMLPALPLQKGALAHRMHFSGVPGGLDAQGRPEPRLSSVYRLLVRAQHARVSIHATPVSPSTLETQCEQNLRHQDALSARLGPGTVGRNSLERELRAATAQGQRLELGRQGGLWEVRVMLESGDPVELWGLGAALQAALRGSPHLPPFRAVDTPTPTLLTSEELGSLLCPPIESVFGFEVRPEARFGLSLTSRPMRALRLGRLQDGETPSPHPFYLDLEHLTSHLLVCGQSGSGKSTTVRTLLGGARALRIPFLVLEPIKCEYRTLGEVAVLAPGSERGTLRLHPFEVPTGAGVQAHLDRLVNLLSGALGLFTPLPIFLASALDAAYRVCGWDLRANTHTPQGGFPRFPRLTLVIEACRAALETAGYSERVGADLGAALIGRLESLTLGMRGAVFDVAAGTPDSTLFERDTVVELEALALDGDKALALGLILLRLRERYEALPPERRASENLRHLTVLEEAHRLLRRVPEDPRHEGANPLALSAALFCDLLAEVRAYGEGLIVCEQIPSLLAEGALKNTAHKLVHRLPAEDDRRLVGGTLALTPAQTLALATLEVGVAVAFTPERREATLVAVERR